MCITIYSHFNLTANRTWSNIYEQLSIPQKVIILTRIFVGYFSNYICKYLVRHEYDLPSLPSFYIFAMQCGQNSFKEKARPWIPNPRRRRRLMKSQQEDYSADKLSIIQSYNFFLCDFWDYAEWVVYVVARGGLGLIYVENDYFVARERSGMFDYVARL